MEFERGRIDPVNILEHDQERLSGGLMPQKLHERGKDLLLVLLRVQFRQRIANTWR